MNHKILRFFAAPETEQPNSPKPLNDTIAKPDVEIEDQIEGTVNKIKRGLVTNQMLKI